MRLYLGHIQCLIFCDETPDLDLWCGTKFFIDVVLAPPRDVFPSNLYVDLAGDNHNHLLCTRGLQNLVVGMVDD